MIDMPVRIETPRPQPQALETWRCARCSRILAKVRLGAGSHIEVKCGSCNTFSYRMVETESDR